eukprot:TRINITY_DN4941_c0_g1_i2.p1 TRINITY_DN4941_c0_g1~~TRINITY_DN4941_c0_g1_i2.p1  ORF type:complete len:426 (+),score=86.18 TRINITY_DN4941_c0_g1_i2:48-1325(+)
MSSPNFGFFAQTNVVVMSETLKKWQSTLNHCKGLYEKSQETMKHIQERALRLDSTRRKISNIASEFKLQDTDVHGMWDIYEDKHSFLLGVQSEILRRYEDVSSSLSQIISSLSDSRIHSSMATEHHKTLSDFVDMDTVSHLQTNTLSEFKAIQVLFSPIGELHEMHLHSRREYESRYRDIIMEYSETKDQATLASTGLAIDVQAIGSLCNSLSSSYDRLIAFSRAQKDRISLTSYQAISKDTETLPNYVTKATRHLNNLKTFKEHLDDELARMESAIPIFVEIYKQLQILVSQTRENIEKLGHMERSVEEKKLGIRFLFEEMENLSAWYHLFQRSYTELLVEIQRRHEEMRKQQEVVDSYNRELVNMHAVESAQRAAFYESFGQYLPYPLCPSIYEPPTRYHIFPERFSTNLPDLEVSKRVECRD